MASLLLLLLLLLPPPLPPAAASPETFAFDLSSLSFRNLTLLGDSYLRSGAVGLTRESGVPSSSSGSFLFNLPIPFLDPRSNLSTSFSTRFSFSITNPSPGSACDGLAFFVSNTSAFFDLFNSSSPSTNSSIIAVEFDTRSGVGHVGLDIGGLIPIKRSDLSPFGIELKSGKAITAWIEYLRDEKTLKVWAGYSSLKPEKPILSASFDLSRYFEHSMYVGFSASTEGGTEVHTIESWSFRTFGFPGIDGHQQSFHNVSNGSWSVLPARPVVDDGKSSHKTLVLCLGIVGSVSIGTALILFALMLVRKRMVSGEGKPVILKGLRQFRYQELSSATKRFNVSRIVGTGAFGTVYRGVDPKTGVAFAVKRSKKSHQSKSEFLAELSIIAELRHKNLVQLQGWCSEKGELLLVYEFMHNGSLDKFLYNEADFGLSLAMDWTRRYSVAIGIASVLTYLHEECDQQVIHRDIKTSNIMLDAHFNARLGDFGLAKLLDHDKSPDSTLTAGTMGYLAPEYLQYGRATDKSDVYSYGVVILEVCCGRRPIEVKDGHANILINLVDWVWSLHSKDRLIEAADHRLNGVFDAESMLRLLLIGLSCVNPICTERPSMRKVLQILNHEAEPILVPKLKPSLTFNSSTSLALQDIVLDCYDSQVSSKLSD